VARQGEYDESQWLTYSLCRLPCWRGIVPGVTRFKDAQRLLRLQPDVTCCYDFIGASRSRATFHLKAAARTYMGVIDSDGLPSAPIGALTFYPDEAADRAPIGALVKEIGLPQQINVVTVRAKQAIYLYFVRLQITVSVDATLASSAGDLPTCGATLPHALVESITISSSDVHYWSGQAWAGFDALAKDICTTPPKQVR
jgi:hypothetical protein